jgi:hypothetical protein
MRIRHPGSYILIPALVYACAMKVWMTTAFALLASTSCKSSSKKPTGTPNGSSAATAAGSSKTNGSDAGSGNAPTTPSADAAEPGSGLTPEQKDFQARIRAVAKAAGADIAAWGTMQLYVAAPGSADDCKAKADPAIAARRHTSGNTATLVSADRQKVSYIFEVSDHKLISATYEVDGRTQLAVPVEFDDKPLPPPPWRTFAFDALHHSQTHRGGYEFGDLMISADKLVIAKHEALEDGRENDKPALKDFALDGGCYCTACPVLATELSIKASLQVTLAGPSAEPGFLGAKAP